MAWFTRLRSRLLKQPTSGDPAMSITTHEFDPPREWNKRFERKGMISQSPDIVVELLRDTYLERDVVMKSEAPGSRPEVRRGLMREAQYLAQLGHPHIVPLYDCGLHPDGRFFLTLKKIEGKTLTNYGLDGAPHFTDPRRIADILAVFLRACRAVAFAHDRGVKHLDLKPDNVMVGDLGQVYVLDWGIAHAPGANAPTGVCGTPEYMSQEQALAEAIDERTDVFGLGAILYELLVGVAPFEDTSSKSAYSRALTHDYVSPAAIHPNLPKRLCAIVDRAMAKRPDDRHTSAHELIEDVTGFLQCGWQFERRRYDAGSDIVEQGQPSKEAFIISSGTCLVRSDLGERRLVDGDVFGEVGVFGELPRTATVRAETDTEVVVISARDFQEDLAVGFWVQLFIKALAGRFADLEQSYVELRSKMAYSPTSIAQALGAVAGERPQLPSGPRYQPKPIDTAAVTLSGELLQLTERLAENTHDQWGAARLASGWRWGPNRDDQWKTNPCLVAYDELPTREKELDRRAAMETLKAVVALGYRVDRTS